MPTERRKAWCIETPDGELEVETTCKNPIQARQSAESVFDADWGELKDRGYKAVAVKVMKAKQP